MPTTADPTAARPASARTATVLVAGACYAGLLAVVVAPMVARSRPGVPVPTSVARAKAEPARVAEAAEAAPAARGFPVPVDDPLLVNEQVYQLLASQDHAPVAGVPEPAQADAPAAPPVSVVAEAPPPPPRPAELPAAPVQPAALTSGEQRGDAFVGVWGSHRAACGIDGNRKGYLLTAIDEAGAWAGETRCAFRDKRRTPEGWSFNARCSSPRERWTARVRLRMDGTRLQWASQRGTQTYVRCERRTLTAQAS